MTVTAFVGGARGRSPVSKPSRPPAHIFEPSFVREQLAERREQELQDAEDWDMAARVGTGDDDWMGSVNE